MITLEKKSNNLKVYFNNELFIDSNSLFIDSKGLELAYKIESVAMLCYLRYLECKKDRLILNFSKYPISDYASGTIHENVFYKILKEYKDVVYNYNTGEEILNFPGTQMLVKRIKSWIKEDNNKIEIATQEDLDKMELLCYL